MKKSAIAAIGAVLLLPLVAVAIFAGLGGGGNTNFGQSGLKTGSVPPQLEAWVIKAGSICPEVPAPLVAAQIEQESGWNPKAVSPTGAQGLSQFEPYTWPSYARDDAGDGNISPFNPPDAIMAQGRFDCSIAAGAKADLASGRIHGDMTSIILAGYNAGYGAVVANGGPDIANGQTQGYIRSIKAKMVKYEQVGTGSGTAPGMVPGGPFGANVVAAAMHWVQVPTPYAWGGGGPDGPSLGRDDYPGGPATLAGDAHKVGFDCSGLTQYAVAQASGHRIILSHYTVTQLDDPRGRAEPLSQVQPGDLVFPAGPSPEHVAIYKGNGLIVQAPESGEMLDVAPLSSLGPNPSVRRFG